MAKLTAWLVTLIGILLILPLIGLDLGEILGTINNWLIPLAVLIVGIGKLIRNYSKR